MSLDAAWALDWTHRAAVMITENRAELTEPSGTPTTATTWTAA